MCARCELLPLLKLVLLLLLSILGNGYALNFPARKTWWTKAITNNLYVTGPLTTTQIKLANDDKFKTIISLFNTSDQSSTSELANITGLKFETVLQASPSSEWATEATIRTFSRVFESSPKPAILHSDDGGYAAAFVGLVYNMNQSRSDPSTLFKHAAVMGYNYIEDMMLKNLVLKVGGGDIKMMMKDDPSPPDHNMPTWYASPTGWKLKHVSQNLWVSGQIQLDDLPMLKELNFMVINLRRGVTVRNMPSQEEAVLLNIKDRTKTYSDGNPVRQLRATLESNRLDPSLPVIYISPNSTYNYQSINMLQFGDHIGYNETVEREAFARAGMDYSHKPVGGVYSYNLPLWEAYRDSLMQSYSRNSPVLLQCRTAFRSTVLAMLMYGCKHDRNITEVLQLANYMGFPFKYSRFRTRPEVKLLKEVLSNREKHCLYEELNGACPATSISVGLSLLVVFITVFILS